MGKTLKTEKTRRNIMNKDLIKSLIGLLLIIIGLTINILFISSPSEEIWHTMNWDYLREGQEDFTIQNPNPLLGNRYLLMEGGPFSVFIGIVEGNVTIMNKATRENQTFQIYVDARIIVSSWDTDNHVVILPPGEYTIFWQTTPISIRFWLYSHGWFLKVDDDPNKIHDGQNMLINFSVIVEVGLVIGVIIFAVRRRKDKIAIMEAKNRILKER